MHDNQANIAYCNRLFFGGDTCRRCAELAGGSFLFSRFIFASVVDVVFSMVREMLDLTEIDRLLDTFTGQRAYDQLKPLYESRAHNGDILWRLARSCYIIANTFPAKHPKRKDFLLHGRAYAKEGYQVDEGNPMVLKWMAVMTGAAIDYAGMMDKIEQGELFRQFIERALAHLPTDYSLLYMRGRYAYSVATLSWIERKAASALFHIPATATIDEALKDFAKVEKLLQMRDRSDLRIQNLFYLARCQLAVGEKTAALENLALAKTIDAVDEAERECRDLDVNALICKHEQ